ncbi:MAG: helix-turn-helix domain-containing protein [Bacteroidota bacterium]|nr:helix-turn-helix domain-containing protein [Bacteroidota bacterium]
MENALLIKNIPGPLLLDPVSFSRHSEIRTANGSNGALRLTDMFIELLEKQFPGSSPNRKMKCRFPVDFADALSVHVNHLNRCLKEITGKTTSQLIADRIILEAGVLLYGSKWNVCEIGYCFGFEEGPHFINFFKKNVKMSPSAYRRLIRSKISDAKDGTADRLHNYDSTLK